MSPLVMALLLAVTLFTFAYSARRRWRLMMVGTPEPRFDQIGRRVRLTLRQGLGQERLGRNRLAGLAHRAIFLGFMVLLLRVLILVARGFVDDPGFGYWIFDGGTLLGNLYTLVKDAFIVLVILGVAVFMYYRLAARLPRMTLSREALLILAMILVIVVSDAVYDGAGHVLAARAVNESPSFNAWQPLGSVLAPIIDPLPSTAVIGIWHAGFWTHIALVLIFLNILPYSKHFHVITAVPNVFFQDLDPPGRLRPIEDIEGRVEREQTLGVRRIGEFSWKGLLDLYTCTECGRCTDWCPASQTGKLLSPKQLTIDLRDHLYRHERALVAGRDEGEHLADLVPAVIDPEALWACTTCRACEQECPVLISYVDKIVDLRRHLVQERGEFPAPLKEAFQSIEVAGNPYGAPEDERLAWADGIDVPVRAEVDGVDVLFWVGCAPAMDERAKGIARAVAQLLNLAGVRWACLGSEERCTGDAARRAGNEFLFQAMAEANIETLNGYGTKTIVTACPHCFNTLKNEYPDFGGRYEVVHHADFLAGLVRDGRLTPRGRVEAKIVYHDSCYLGRYNDLYDSPRSLLKSIPGVTLVEARENRDRGMCCGAGGAQMFKEEEPGEQRVSAARTLQLVQTGADVIATACPFCKRMITDALADDEEGQRAIDQLDIAELLLKSVAGGGAGTGAAGGDRDGGDGGDNGGKGRRRGTVR